MFVCSSNISWHSMFEKSGEGVKACESHGLGLVQWASIGVTAPSSLYKSEPSGLRGQTTPVFRRGNISRTQRPQTPPSYQFWCKAVCLLHVGWGPDLGYSVVLVFIVFLPAETSILLPGENFINVA